MSKEGAKYPASLSLYAAAPANHYRPTIPAVPSATTTSDDGKIAVEATEGITEGDAATYGEQAALSGLPPPPPHPPIFALKKLHGHLAQHADVLREVGLMRRLKSTSSVIDLICVLPRNDCTKVSMVMEYAPMDLRKWIAAFHCHLLRHEDPFTCHRERRNNEEGEPIEGAKRNDRGTAAAAAATTTAVNVGGSDAANDEGDAASPFTLMPVSPQCTGAGGEAAEGDGEAVPSPTSDGASSSSTVEGMTEESSKPKTARKRQPHVPLSHIRALLKDMLEGCGEMHARGILHRDIKPENILVFPFGPVPVPSLASYPTTPKGEETCKRPLSQSPPRAEDPAAETGEADFESYEALMANRDEWMLRLCVVPHGPRQFMDDAAVFQRPEASVEWVPESVERVGLKLHQLHCRHGDACAVYKKAMDATTKPAQRRCGPPPSNNTLPLSLRHRLPRAKIGDFGSARMEGVNWSTPQYDAGGVAFAYNRSGPRGAEFTRAAHRGERWHTWGITTPYYRAPEVLLRGSYAFAADIWAVGCIFYELATGNMLLPQEHLVSRGQMDHDTTDWSFLLRTLHVTGMPTAAEWEEIALPQYYPVEYQKHLLPRFTKGLSHGHGLLRDPHASAVLKDLLTECGYDLLVSMLEFHPDRRPTADEALEHPFFSMSL